MQTNLFRFIAAALSLLWGAWFLSPSDDVIHFLFLSWIVCCGVVLHYRMNLIFSWERSLLSNWSSLKKNRMALVFLLHLAFIVFPFAFYELRLSEWFILGVPALFGFIYAFRTKGSVRLKDVFLLKNFAIGISWGSLLMLGFQNELHQEHWIVFLFMSWQVMLGSMIRDLSDVVKDAKSKTFTLPVVMGISGAHEVLVLMNFLSAIAFVWLWSNPVLSVVLMGVVLWRMVNIQMIMHLHTSGFWFQRMNLFTCQLFFLLVILMQ
jgi:4-hydroxybenzoate polyprenyltransferase